MSVAFEQAAALVRRLSWLRGYPRAWGSDPAEVEQATAAESALIEAAAAAPRLEKLEVFVADWERRKSDAPKAADFWDAWRGPEIPEYRTRTSTRCPRCDDSGWRTVYVVSDALGAGRRAEQFEIPADQVDAWWERIRSTPGCAQRVYDEARRCDCGRVAAPAPENAHREANDTRQGSKLEPVGEYWQGSKGRKRA